jgi:hypothetical protein
MPICASFLCLAPPFGQSIHVIVFGDFARRDGRVDNLVRRKDRRLPFVEIDNSRTDVAGKAFAPVYLRLGGILGPAVEEMVYLPEVSLTVKN